MERLERTRLGGSVSNVEASKWPFTFELSPWKANAVAATAV